MIDAWEIIGRVLTDADFRNTVLKCGSTKPYPVNATSRADIPDDDYDRLRDAVGTKVKGPISLMALGEMLIAMRIPGLKEPLGKLAAAICNTGVNTTDRTPLFYAALGAAMVDQELLKQLPYDVKRFGFDLTQKDEDDLKNIITDQNVIDAEDPFCMSCWSEGCNLKMLYWEGHLHPIENPFLWRF